MPSSSNRVVLTGIKPSGTPHLGNYVGAIAPALRLLTEAGERGEATDFFYFVADYHAVTSIQDGDTLRHLTREVAATWLALGLDPDAATIYRQSDVPEVFELAWILACVCPKGLMNRAHAYKAAVQRNEEEGRDGDAGVNMGLFGYPVLMAADILIMRSTHVPVGEDQRQHVEYARDLVTYAETAFGAGSPLVAPEAMISKEQASIPGTDGRKMSKSYGNIIPIFADDDALRSAVFGVVTDSRALGEPADPDTTLLYQIFEGVGEPEDVAELRAGLERGFGWKDAKELVYEGIRRRFAEPRARYDELMGGGDELESILREGAEKARDVASHVVGDLRAVVGTGPASRD
jgi:tryptophanyl-tRNA synthetase